MHTGAFGKATSAGVFFSMMHGRERLFCNRSASRISQFADNVCSTWACKVLSPQYRPRVWKGRAMPETSIQEPYVQVEGQGDRTAIVPISATQTREMPLQRPRASSYLVPACIILIVALSLLGSMLNVGDHLMAVHPVLGWLFYGLLVALVVAGVVMPIIKVAKRPVFSLYQLRDERGSDDKRHCRMLVDNLVANTDISPEDAARLERYLEQDDASELLIEYFTTHCVPAIDGETKKAAGTAFLVAAVVRSPLVATVTMLSICFDLVRAVVETCGFRPTNLGLARLYSRVMISALIIGGLEDSDLSDLIGQLMGGGAGARVGGLVIGATAEGLVSAFLVFRVGVITKRWLTAADGPERMSSIRRKSYREALALMRSGEFMQIVTDSVKKMSTAVAEGVTSSVANAAKSTVESARSTVEAAAKATADAAKSVIPPFGKV